ncbi:hypothetical protein HG536_0A00830 [Torulaspora globosa]|uniref:Copper transport protein n=1 Tax=Torulaspora globosa TaxID=48254 RepID=A0A7G3Z9T0_9SACH|nr:uncharacterized protein HG536_0A00830 [Torulaspora globosa]QLL30266.1 hypothetical protein HG536_0A00830 [Torulaspora globosa]
MQHHDLTSTAGMSHGHGDMDMGDSDSCSMNMLFTWSYKNTCVIFRWWHIKTIYDLFLSFLAILFLSYLYEYLRYYIYKSQQNHGVLPGNSSSPERRRNKLYQSCWYGLQVGFSFMLMLVFMTYNGWLMIAVVLGATWGHYSWGARVKSATDEIPSMACH